MTVPSNRNCQRTFAKLTALINQSVFRGQGICRGFRGVIYIFSGLDKIPEMLISDS